jgi:DNA-binding IscR family transcriptional regulator
MGYSTSFTQGITLLLTLHAMQTNTGNAITPTKLLAKYAGIPFASAVKTLKSLSSAGITVTKEGVGGGSMLAKPIPQITLLDVFLAVEQDAPLFKTHAGINCDHPLAPVLKKRVELCISNAADAMKDSLGRVTLEHIWEGSL